MDNKELEEIIKSVADSLSKSLLDIQMSPEDIRDMIDNLTPEQAEAIMEVAQSFNEHPENINYVENLIEKYSSKGGELTYSPLDREEGMAGIFDEAEKLFKENRSQEKTSLDSQVLNALNTARRVVAEKDGVFDWMLAEHFGITIDLNEAGMISVYDLYGDMVEDKLREMSPEEAIDLIEEVLGESKKMENNITVEDIGKATSDISDREAGEILDEINEKNKDIVH